MANSLVANTSEERLPEQRDPHANGVAMLGVRNLSWLPLSLVVLSLAGLAITPLVLQQRTRNLREDVREVGEPGRLLLGELRLGLARELSTAERFALTGASSDWFGYHRAASRDDSLVARLDETLRAMGRSSRLAVANLKKSITQWRAQSAMNEEIGSTDALRQAAQHGIDYEDLLAATVRVDSAVAHAMQTRRVEIDEAEDLEVRFAIAFVIFGCAASAAVLVLTLRDRHLRTVLRRRAEEEASLRRLAGSLSGALTVDEVGTLTVSSALHSSRIGGAYVAREKTDQLVTIASGGSNVPAVGTCAPTPAWMKEGADSGQPRIFTAEVHVRPGSAAASDIRRVGSLLVVPLSHDGVIIGALGITSAGGRRQFRESSLRFGRALGDLAAVALHRAQALESERAARAAAESAVRTRDAVVSIVSHDLRNPLMAIVGTADLLLESTRDDGQGFARSQLAILKHAADSMTRLIRDLLDITRLESGPLPVRRQRIDLTDVVDEVVAMFSVVVRARRITLYRDVPPQLPAVYGDSDRLAQALSNLLGNAVKFTPDGGQIRVSVDLQPRGVRICVRDTGPGIPEDQIPHLFDRFWQASREDSRGLGLGLMIVKAIVDAHGGFVDVESSLAHGSTFCITVPRADVDARPQAQTLTAGRERRPSLNREQVMVTPPFAEIAPPLA
jgi:signal transduction histidine kinase